MTEWAYLAYLPDPFAVRSSLFCMRVGGEVRHLSATEVAEFSGHIVTYDVAALIDDLRRLGVNSPRHPVDLSDALRMCIGRPKDEVGEKAWEVWRYLKKSFAERSDWEVFSRTFASQIERPDALQLKHLLESCASAVEIGWRNIQADLAESEELERFQHVEVPVQAIFAHRQNVGIAIDKAALSDLLNAVRNEKYRAYAQVASALNRNPTHLNFWSIAPYLSNTDASHLGGARDGGQLREAFKLAARNSEFAKNFLQYVDAARDETSLKRAEGLGDRIQPLFQIVGTVSGRVLVSDPHLQQLRRQYRSILVADPGMKLAYLDYAQFEPGVLAELSGDEKLVAAYNSADLYSALSESVFGSSELRPLAKRMFLAFCYGMKPDSIAKLVCGKSASDDERESYSKRVLEFFGSFPGLQSYRDDSAKRLLETGSVSSVWGNRRLRAEQSIELTEKEKRWAVNQPVQATASLIFKEALIALSNQFGRDSILLPMHDAVLMQFVDDGTYDENVSTASKLMELAFVKRCPKVRPSISTEPFSTP